MENKVAEVQAQVHEHVLLIGAEALALVAVVATICYIIYLLYTRTEVAPEDRDGTLVAIGIFAFLGFMIREFGDDLSEQVVATVVGGLSTSVGMVVAFYYNRSRNRNGANNKEGK